MSELKGDEILTLLGIVDGSREHLRMLIEAQPESSSNQKRLEYIASLDRMTNRLLEQLE